MLAVKGLAAMGKSGYISAPLTVGLVCIAVCIPVDTDEKRLTVSERKRHKWNVLVAALVIVMLAATA